MYQDGIGSTDAITYEHGHVLERMSFDAFGKRRSARTRHGASAGIDDDITEPRFKSFLLLTYRERGVAVTQASASGSYSVMHSGEYDDLHCAFVKSNRQTSEKRKERLNSQTRGVEKTLLVAVGNLATLAGAFFK